MKKIITAVTAALLLMSASAAAQSTGHPSLGAQVFIEPGQSPEQIDSWFATLEKSGFEYARIRLFGCHLCKDGLWDFSLYDTAFEAAARHGIKLFATLFPDTDELNDVGGFKFPSTEKQLEEVLDYVDRCVEHFAAAPAMYAWVLQNEPGLEATAAPQTELSIKMRAVYDASHPAPVRTAYLLPDFSDQQFLRWYTCWYLNLIAEKICSRDTVHYRHINPHHVLETLPEYDFKALRTFVTSMGSSMHLSWHFEYFERNEFPMAISFMSDIMRSSALGNPFWITEMQGGNVTASGRDVLCPTRDEISQWLLSGIGSGAEGVLFWTLNQRAAVREAGEWGMITYQGAPSDRLEAASDIARFAASEPAMASAVPTQSGITILYNTESLWIQKLNAAYIPDTKNEGRQAGAVMRSAAAAYEAIASWGVIPQVCDMEYFDWTSDGAGRAIVLPNIICLPSRYHDRLEHFVSTGGKLIVTGLTGYYDENWKCAYMDSNYLYADIFGGTISEFKATSDYFPIATGVSGPLTAHWWRGLIIPENGATALASMPDGVTAVRSKHGLGECYWLPASVDMGCWHRDELALAQFYGTLLKDLIDATPVHFAKPQHDVLLRTMDSDQGLVLIALNKTPGKAVLPLVFSGDMSLKNASTVYSAGNATKAVRGRSLVLMPEQAIVLKLVK